MEQPGAIVPIPPANVDDADEDGGEGPRDGGPLDDVEEDEDDDPLEIEGAPMPNAPRMSHFVLCCILPYKCIAGYH